MKTISLLSFFFLLFTTKAQNTDSLGVKNLHKVASGLYRSAQPSKEEFKILDSAGFETILSLRNRVSDKRRARTTSLTIKRYRVNAWRMDEEDVLQALRLIQSYEKPLLLHCLHGSDRTGVIVAAYRMVFEGWTKERALAEFQNPKYGYHEGWFPGLTNLIRNMNVEYLKKELQ